MENRHLKWLSHGAVVTWLTPGAYHPGYPSARLTTTGRLHNLRTIVQPLRGWYFMLVYAPGDEHPGLTLSSHSVAYVVSHCNL